MADAPAVEMAEEFFNIFEKDESGNYIKSDKTEEEIKALGREFEYHYFDPDGTAANSFALYPGNIVNVRQGPDGLVLTGLVFDVRRAWCKAAQTHDGYGPHAKSEIVACVLLISELEAASDEEASGSGGKEGFIDVPLYWVKAVKPEYFGKQNKKEWCILDITGDRIATGTQLVTSINFNGGIRDPFTGRHAYYFELRKSGSKSYCPDGNKSKSACPHCLQPLLR
jgi:hypothetical protein